jgi:peptidoglycan hydrolase CwlO-like protein
MKSIHFLIVALFFTILTSAQDTSEVEQAKDPSAIEDLRTVVDESNNYQQYKVIEKVEINAAIKKVFSEFDLLTAEISELKDSIQSQDKQIQSLKKEVSGLNTELTNLQSEKDEIQFLGMSLTKSAYNLMVWSIIGVLIALLLFFIFKFNRSNLLTKEAKQNLKNLDADYENYKRIALEKQQKLGRQLQDEKNKNQKLNKGNQK